MGVLVRPMMMRDAFGLTKQWCAALWPREATARVHRPGPAAVRGGVGGGRHMERRVRHRSAQVGGRQ